MDGGLFNVRESVLDGALKGVHREGLCVLRRLDCRLGRSHDSVAFKGGDLNYLAAELAGELIDVYLVAVLPDDVHHVDGDNNGDAELGQLGSEIEVSFEVRTVDYVKYSVRALIDKIVSRDNFLKGVGRERVDTGKVGDDNAVMLFEFSFFFSTVTPGQLPTNWFEPVRALNNVVLPLLGLPARAMRKSI